MHQSLPLLSVAGLALARTDRLADRSSNYNTCPCPPEPGYGDAIETQTIHEPPTTVRETVTDCITVTEPALTETVYETIENDHEKVTEIISHDEHTDQITVTITRGGGDAITETHVVSETHPPKAPDGSNGEDVHGYDGGKDDSDKYDGDESDGLYEDDYGYGGGSDNGYGDIDEGDDYVGKDEHGGKDEYDGGRDKCDESEKHDDKYEHDGEDKNDGKNDYDGEDDDSEEYKDDSTNKHYPSPPSPDTEEPKYCSHNSDRTKPCPIVVYGTKT